MKITKVFFTIQGIYVACIVCAAMAYDPQVSMAESAPAKIVTYPAPAGEAVATDYTVTVGGRPVDVYAAQSRNDDGKYYFASFDFSGETEVRITSRLPMDKVEILPESAGIKSKADGKDAITFMVNRPFKVSIERDGQNSPLLLFGNPLEENPPKQGDPNVIYFGPGVHKPGKISVKSNQTLYLAGGAVVKGGICAEGENIKILGRGILDGSDWARAQGPTFFMVRIEKCKNVVIKDVTLRSSFFWTVVPCGSDKVTVENVKICGSRDGNDDGINSVNSSNVTIRNCFIRTDDDCIAVKGLGGYDNKACENITVTDCTFWTDQANIFRIGYECEAAAMRDITARNIDVIHFVANRPIDEFWVNTVWYIQPANELPMSGLRFEDFRINAAGQNNTLVKILPMRVRGFIPPPPDAPGNQAPKDMPMDGPGQNEPGRYVKDCYFKNIRLDGKAGGRPGMIYVAGADAKHPVEGVIFENFYRFGQPVRSDSPDVQVGPHASNIKFLNTQK